MTMHAVAPSESAPERTATPIHVVCGKPACVRSRTEFNASTDTGELPARARAAGRRLVLPAGRTEDDHAVLVRLASLAVTSSEPPLRLALSFTISAREAVFASSTSAVTSV